MDKKIHLKLKERPDLYSTYIPVAGCINSIDYYYK